MTCLKQKLKQLYQNKWVLFRWAISDGFYGKLFPRSGILKDHCVTIDAGVIDADFRGITKVLILNHHPEKTLLFVLQIELHRLLLWKSLM